MKKFELRLIYLYLLWQVLYIPLAIKNSIPFFNNNGGVNVTSCLNYIYDLLFKLWPSNINGWFPSWYIIGMIIAVPFSILAYKYIFRRNNFLYGLFCIIVEIYFILRAEFGFLVQFKTDIINPDSFPRFLIYIFLGFLIAKNIEIIKNYNSKNVFRLACILIVFFYIENVIVKLLGGSISNDETILTVPTSLVVVIFSILYTPNISNTTPLRKFSTFLYCFQAWALAIFDHFNYFIGLQNTTSEITKFVFVMITAIIAFQIYTFISRKTRWGFLGYMV